MNDTIIVGVRDAAATRRAIDWAARRAADRNLSLELVTVVGDVVGAVGEARLIAEILDATHRALDAEAARIQAEFGVRAKVTVPLGNTVAKLLDASQSASMLVIGSDYKGPEGGRARGVHGVRIVAAARCPVVVVPDAEPEGRKGVVVGVDGSDVSSKAIAFAADEADRLNEPLIAVTVWTPIVAPHTYGVIYSDQYLENMELLAGETLALSIAGLRQDYPDLEIVSKVEKGYPSQVINELAATARLTVMGSHGRGRIVRFLLGSISQEVLERLATVTAIVR